MVARSRWLSTSPNGAWLNPRRNPTDKRVMSNAPAEHIDLLCAADGNFSFAPDGSVEPLDAAEQGDAQALAADCPVTRRPWVGIQFGCCGIYRRVYREPDECWYIGRCPRCGREARLRVAPHGTNARFFVAKPL